MHGNDNDKQIFFYEHEFYVFSNYSSFALEWKGKLYPTSEHAYHSEKFLDENLKDEVRLARSAHASQKFSEANVDKRRPDWDDVKLGIMKDILRAKVEQHPYVKKKLLQSVGKELIEDSWCDPFWGWGPNKDGENHLGKLWMEIREEFANK
ncbi:MAG: NADAR family protein [bacterium]